MESRRLRLLPNPEVAFLALASLLGVAVPVAFWWFAGDDEARETPDFVIAHFVVCQLPFLLSWWMAKLARSWRVAVWGAAWALAVLLLVYLVVFLSVRTDPFAAFLLLPLPTST